jgi:CheY-like chemotaxis protein
MRPKVLVVDDDEATAAVVQMQLKLEGIEAVTAFSGRQALEMLCQATVSGDSYQLMLLDIAMPELSGWDVLHAVKANPLWADIRVIVLTGYALTPSDIARVADYDGVHVEKKEEYAAAVSKLAERLLSQNAET